MSTYTIGEIAIWLILAAVLGFALGWLVRELTARRHVATVPVPDRAPAPSEPAAAKPEPSKPEPSKPEPSKPAPVVVTAGPHPGSALPLPDGSAPTPDHTIKVSGSSKIYHGPSSPAWGRTTAAFWFTTAEAAEAAGFRKPKNG